MRVTELTPDHVRLAMRIYMERAWPEESGAATDMSRDEVDARSGDSGAEDLLLAPVVQPQARLEDFEDAQTLDELFERFEGRPEEQRGGMRYYALRLGNPRYPFMKLVVQEYLVDDQMFFSVDTHDDLAVESNAPDFDRWVALKRWNRELKDRIEDAWEAAGLPTHERLIELTERIVEEEGGSAEKRGHVLVVDDERDVAVSVSALLGARGYDVEVAHTGERALERLAVDPLPDLVLLDYDMPGVAGYEVLGRLRADPRTAELPILMATARAMELSELPRASGFLRKPYARELLYRIVAEFVRPDAASPDGNSEDGTSAESRGPLPE